MKYLDQNGRRIFAILADGKPVFVSQGEMGFAMCHGQRDLEKWADISDRQTPAVTLAATAGSMFGWDTPAAAAAVRS